MMSRWFSSRDFSPLRRSSWLSGSLSFLLLLGAVVSTACSDSDTDSTPAATPDSGAASPDSAAVSDMAPELVGGVAWLNTPEPLRLSDQLAGHVVLLDFWTFGCVNCLHMIPVLRDVEEQFTDTAFVTIGVHSAKFESEGDAQNIQFAMQHYGVQHPVIVDSELVVWNNYGVWGWPTLILLDSTGQERDRWSGETPASTVATAIQALLDEGAADGTLTGSPLNYLVDPNEASTTPLLFPTKILAMADGRLAIADSAHHRIVIVNDDGTTSDIIGSGIEGLSNGPVASAQLARPQGMTVHNGALLIADTENHVIRSVDLDARTISTIAGMGEMGNLQYLVRHGWFPADDAALRSPWDLESTVDGVVVAMAGSHQLFFLDPVADQMRVFAGSGLESIDNGAPADSSFSQPSGFALSPDGTTLYVADSEASAIRALSVPDAVTETLVGTGLFDFGDIDGIGDLVRLELAVGVETLADGTLLIADTYNSKIKRLDPTTREVTSLSWPATPLELNEPRGLSRRGDDVFISDTNNHRILRHNLATDITVEFVLSELQPPALSGAVSD